MLKAVMTGIVCGLLINPAIAAGPQDNKDKRGVVVKPVKPVAEKTGQNHGPRWQRLSSLVGHNNRLSNCWITQTE